MTLSRRSDGCSFVLVFALLWALFSCLCLKKWSFTPRNTDFLPSFPPPWMSREWWGLQSCNEPGMYSIVLSFTLCAMASDLHFTDQHSLQVAKNYITGTEAATVFRTWAKLSTSIHLKCANSTTALGKSMLVLIHTSIQEGPFFVNILVIHLNMNKQIVSLFDKKLSKCPW